MSFRARLLLACLALALAPLIFFGVRARGEVAAQLGAQHAERVAALTEVIAEDLERESAMVAARLDRLADAVAADSRLRRALQRGVPAPDRAYLLDYASRAMPLAGLDFLRVQDEEGRVLSSGHFRNEYDAFDPALPTALLAAGNAGVLADFPTPTGSALGLARGRPLQLGERTLTLVGGVRVDERFLGRLARGSGLEVELRAPGEVGGRGAASLIRMTTADAFVIRASTDPLAALRREMDRWLLVTLAAAAALALLLALVASARLGRPLSRLAHEAERLDLDRLDVDFPTDRSDEVGTLSRVLDRMTARLRASAVRLREAERRAAVGELARQVNHDLRNGLVPIRNVVRHLAGAARERPEELAALFLERQGTVDASLDYLDALAASYARLSPKPERRPCDLNAIVHEVAEDASRVVTELDPELPAVHADPVALRRILENLVVNAVDSMDGTPGPVVVWTRRGQAPEARPERPIASGAGEPEPPRVLLGVSDRGRGMTAEERARAFDHFYSTKPGGSGLGLSIVRRLVTDLDGRIEVESEPGVGTHVTVDLPVAPAVPGGGAAGGADGGTARGSAGGAT